MRRGFERMVFYPQFLDPPEDVIGRNGRIVRRATLAGRAYCPPWRCAAETRVIKQLAWQWWKSREPRKWGRKKVARLLGVGPAWIRTLRKRFEANPELWRRRFAAEPPATLGTLLRAREETRRLRERGLLRRPLRWMRVSYVWEGKKRRQYVETRAENRRRTGRKKPGPKPFDAWGLPYDQLPLWARGMMPEFIVPGVPGGVADSGWPPADADRRNQPVHFARKRWVNR